MKAENPAGVYEFGYRALHAIVDENQGSPYHRINILRGRALDAVLWSGLGEDPRDPSEWDEDTSC